MPFDAGFADAKPAATPVAAPVTAAQLIDAAVAPDADWARRNPARAMAFLFVAPQECAAADALMEA